MAGSRHLWQLSQIMIKSSSILGAPALQLSSHLSRLPWRFPFLELVGVCRRYHVSSVGKKNYKLISHKTPHGASAGSNGVNARFGSDVVTLLAICGKSDWVVVGGCQLFVTLESANCTPPCSPRVMPAKRKKVAASGPSTAPSGFMLMCQLADSSFNAIGYLFGVDVLPTMRVAHIQELIKIKKPNPLSNRNPDDLLLWMLKDPWPISDEDGGVSSVNELLNRLRDDPGSIAHRLLASSRVSKHFKEDAPDDCLHLVVQVSISDTGEVS